MRPKNTVLAFTLLPALLAVALILSPSAAFAHCDTMEGPVVKDAEKALDTGNVNLVLVWVQPKDEQAIRDAFAHTRKVRQLGHEARKLADQYFFETLVRIHRAGEGAPFTGILPAGSVELNPAVASAEAALEKGQADALVKKLSEEVAKGVSDRFAKAREKKLHAGESVAAGREYVEAYIDFIHFVEKVDAIAAESGAHHEESSAAAPQHHHE